MSRGTRGYIPFGQYISAPGARPIAPDLGEPFQKRPLYNRCTPISPRSCDLQLSTRGHSIKLIMAFTCTEYIVQYPSDKVLPRVSISDGWRHGRKWRLFDVITCRSVYLQYRPRNLETLEPGQNGGGFDYVYYWKMI